MDTAPGQGTPGGAPLGVAERAWSSRWRRASKIAWAGRGRTMYRPPVLMSDLATDVAVDVYSRERRDAPTDWVAAPLTAAGSVGGSPCVAPSTQLRGRTIGNTSAETKALHAPRRCGGMR